MAFSQESCPTSPGSGVWLKAQPATPLIISHWFYKTSDEWYVPSLSILPSFSPASSKRSKNFTSFHLITLYCTSLNSPCCPFENCSLLLKLFVSYILEAKKTYSTLLFTFSSSVSFLSSTTLLSLPMPFHPLDPHSEFFPNSPQTGVSVLMFYTARTLLPYLGLDFAFSYSSSSPPICIATLCIFIGKWIRSLFVRQKFIFVDTLPLDNTPFIFLGFASLISSHTSLGVQHFLCDHLQHKLDGGYCTQSCLFSPPFKLSQLLPQNHTEKQRVFHFSFRVSYYGTFIFNPMGHCYSWAIHLS